MSMMQRTVQPEILDTLAHDDPAALANRRDLRLYNRLMGNFKWMASTLPMVSSGDPVIELGAGDGSLGLYLLRQGIVNRKSPYTGVDLWDAPIQWPKDWPWLKKDLLTIDYSALKGTLLANLILHQFTEQELILIGKKIEQSGLHTLLITEPARRRRHLWQVWLSLLLGINHVSLHDARVSIRGGFRQKELFHLLGLSRSGWDVHWEETFMGANRLICTAAGGEILEPAREMPERGTLAFVRDPQEAVFILAKSSTGDPVDTLPPVNSWLWNELWTHDIEAAKELYENVFGYTPEKVETGPNRAYYLLKKNDEAVAGMLELLEKDVRPHWVPFIRVKDVRSAFEKAVELGANPLIEPNPDVRRGMIALLQGPTGEPFVIQMFEPASE